MKVGLIIVSLYIFVAFFIKVLELTKIVDNFSSSYGSEIYQAPSFKHFCGTDRLGRDVCIRTLQGSNIAIEIVLFSLVLSLGIGLPLGLISGYLGGVFDKCLSTIMDTIFSIPVILLSVVMAFFLGKGILNAAFALCIVYSPQYYRLVRNQTLLLKSETFVEAARVSGADIKRVIFVFKFSFFFIHL